MKKKLLIISTSLALCFLVVAVVAFFLMKSADTVDMKKGQEEEYDVSQIVDKIKFLKLNTYEEIEKYADEYPVYIQTSESALLFAIGELYIEDAPVELIYQLNEDGTLKRFDGKYSYKLAKSSADEVERIIGYFNSVIAKHFSVEMFGHVFYDESGAPISSIDEQIYSDMLEGKAKYGLSAIDESNTYWYITITAKDKKTLVFEFFRCFDLSMYNDDAPNIDLRAEDESGE